MKMHIMTNMINLSENPRDKKSRKREEKNWDPNPSRNRNRNRSNSKIQAEGDRISSKDKRRNAPAVAKANRKWYPTTVGCLCDLEGILCVAMLQLRHPPPWAPARCWTPSLSLSLSLSVCVCLSLSITLRKSSSFIQEGPREWGHLRSPKKKDMESKRRSSKKFSSYTWYP